MPEKLRPLHSSKDPVCGRRCPGLKPEVGGSRHWNKTQIEVEESDVESNWSGLGGKKSQGWRQEVSFALEEIRELLREQNGHLKRITQGLDRGSGAGSEEVEDSTIRE